MVIAKKHALATCHEAQMTSFAANSMFPKKCCGRAGNPPAIPEMAGKELAASLYCFPGMHVCVCVCTLHDSLKIPKELF